MVLQEKQNLKEIVDRVEQNESSLMPMEMRLKLVRDIMGLRVDKPAEYAVITGCRSPYTFKHLAYFGALLHYLGTSYTLLSAETCCGESYIQKVDHKNHEEAAAYESWARQLSGRNIERIRKLGINKIITVCAGCMTRYSHMWGDSGLEILYYPQYLLPRLEDMHLGIDVNYYEGCHQHHRTPKYQIDTKTPKELIGKIQGLTVTKTLPNYCCRILGEKIFAASDRPVIVTPTSCCAGILPQKRTDTSPVVKQLTEVLCESLGIRWTLDRKTIWDVRHV